MNPEYKDPEILRALELAIWLAEDSQRVIRLALQMVEAAAQQSALGNVTGGKNSTEEHLLNWAQTAGGQTWLLRMGITKAEELKKWAAEIKSKGLSRNITYAPTLQTEDSANAEKVLLKNPELTGPEKCLLAMIYLGETHNNFINSRLVNETLDRLGVGNPANISTAMGSLENSGWIKPADEEIAMTGGHKRFAYTPRGIMQARIIIQRSLEQSGANVSP